MKKEDSDWVKSGLKLYQCTCPNNPIILIVYKIIDSKKRIISSKLLFKGTVDRSLVHPREVFKEAYLLSASSIICVHNHPSGNINPSREDCFLTKMLKEVGEIMGIEVNDHIIVGKDNYYSFFENGEIWKK